MVQAKATGTASKDDAGTAPAAADAKANLVATVGHLVTHLIP
jgi:hypothetical protein